jgi:endonuclease/exonuclease/phosphatase family metal-dependent hydrolase
MLVWQPVPSNRSIALAILVGAVMAAVLGFLIFTLQPFGGRLPTFSGVAVVLIGLQLLRRRKPLAANVSDSIPTSLRKISSGLARHLLNAFMVSWLGLIAWAEMSPGGQQPAPKSETSWIRTITWNILRGGDGGPPWLRGDWPARKDALASALALARPDILCVQEARQEQLVFLERSMPGHLRVGVGRDDGEAGGEHCAIFFAVDRFQRIDEGTFWLEEPSDRPAGWRLSGPKRICTWVRLRDRQTGRAFRVYNTHLYLTEVSRQRAVLLILAQIAQSDSAEPILLAGDFNATEESPSRRLFARARLESTATLATQQPQPTYQFYGIPLRNLDEILASPEWEVHAHEVLDVKPGNRYPSDHFGVMADLTLQAPVPDSRHPGG